ncbi:uncharacterized protein LOC120358860 isoform X2 [Solenopsis invicta]|uniref:uncharacterized protein LOC120358860 isoform X2 n=1 Tax=Solenopsis invicta TaxID=13686 RepID=UPI00193D2905|nr:uncharacterized protein LOC120358860 isoform X2 [Solenopsis invicta]
MLQRDRMTNAVALTVQIGLRSIGFWPNTPCALLFRAFWILTIGIVQTCQYWWIIIHFRTDNMFYLMDGLSVAIEYTVMSLKLIILWLNSRIFYDVLAAMAADWREAAISEMDTMMSKANLSRRFSKVIVGLHSIAVVCFGIEVLVSAHTDDYDVDGMETPVRAFTLKLQRPLQFNESPLYEIVVCLEFLHQLASSTVSGVLNCLLITLILHTSGQIEILCDALRDISFENKNEQLGFFMKELIVKHQKIIIFSDKIERIFSYIALIQFLSSTLLICCVGFTVITSKMIGDAAYKSLWYDFKPNESKFILLIILRSQRRLTITAGKIMDLSLEGFTTIMKASVSYISVLHAMY